MYGFLIALLVIVVIAIVLIAWIVGLYNGLVVLKNRFKNAFAQIDVQLRRRYDLIPNLVETAKGYLKHERETLTAVIEARNQAAGAAKALAAAPGDPAAVKAFSAAESGLAGVPSRARRTTTPSRNTTRSASCSRRRSSRESSTSRPPRSLSRPTPPRSARRRR